jgi:hypothetical protein
MIVAQVVWDEDGPLSMARMIAELYDALRSVGADDDKARAAATAVAESDRDIADLRLEMSGVRTEMAEVRGDMAAIEVDGQIYDGTGARGPGDGVANASARRLRIAGRLK